MKGYYTAYGYYGYLPSVGKYQCFATANEYEEYFEIFERGQ